MLVPPRVGEMAACASLRQDAGERPTIKRRPSRFFRQSLERLGRLVNRRHGRNHTLSRHPLGIAIGSFGACKTRPDSEFGEVQSVTTFESDETLHNEVLVDKPHNVANEYGFLSVHAEKFPHSISGTQAKLVLSPPLHQKAVIDIPRVDVDFRNDSRRSRSKRKGLVELPKTVRKDIWRKAIVHDRKLFICSC